MVFPLLPPGIIVPLMPFFTPDGKYDFAAVEKQVDYSLAAGVAGIFALTTCGQSASFSLEENKDLVAVVLNTVQQRVPVYVGIGRTKEEPEYTPQILEYTIDKDAQAAVVLCTDMNTEEQVDHFKKLDGRKFPLIAYSLGTQQKQLPRLEEILSLDSVVGLKVTIDIRDPQNNDYFRRAVSLGKPVFMGEDIVLYDALELGAAGGVNAVANLIPQELVALHQRYREGDETGAQSLQEKINALLSVLYYGKDSAGKTIDAASAFKDAMSHVLAFGGSTIKNVNPTYTTEQKTMVKRFLRDFGLLS